MKYINLFVFIVLFVSACTIQQEPQMTPVNALVSFDVPTSTPTLPPTLTYTPTITPLPPTSTPTYTPTITPSPTNTPTPTPTAECIGAFPTRLSIGDRAKVITYQLNVRTGPGTSYALVNRLPVDRVVTILDGPQCSNGQLWYLIKSDVYTTKAGYEVQVTGWSVEESGDTYYLAPLD